MVLFVFVVSSKSQDSRSYAPTYGRDHPISDACRPNRLGASQLTDIIMLLYLYNNWYSYSICTSGIRSSQGICTIFFFFFEINKFGITLLGFLEFYRRDEGQDNRKNSVCCVSGRVFTKSKYASLRTITRHCVSCIIFYTLTPRRSWAAGGQLNRTVFNTIQLVYYEIIYTLLFRFGGKKKMKRNCPLPEAARVWIYRSLLLSMYVLQVKLNHEFIFWWGAGDCLRQSHECKTRHFFFNH